MSLSTAFSTLADAHRDEPLAFWKGAGITALIILLHQSFMAWGWT